MASFQDLTKEQETLAADIKHFISNYKKDGAARKTAEYLQKKRRELEEQWQRFDEKDNILRTKFEDQEDHEYFTKRYYEQVREGYENALEDIENKLDAIRAGIAGTKPLQTTRTPSAADPTGSQPGASADKHMKSVGTKRFEEQTADNKKMTSERRRTQDIIRKQITILNVLERNISKATTGDQLQPDQFYQIKAETIQKYLHEAQTLHQEIWRLLDNPIAAGYDVERFFAIEEIAQNTIIELLRSRQQVSTQYESTSTPTHDNVPVMKLPKIVLPKFAGEYLKWREFCDLFTELIHNQRIANCQKMWYLKTSLSGEAEKLIRHLTVSDANYTAAWKIIYDRYENKRLLVTAFLNKLLAQPTFIAENPNSIRNLHDTTQECLHGLQNLGVETTNWDPLIIHLLLKRIDKTTYTLYEQTLQHPRSLPTLKEFLAFLETRFQSLEALGSKSRSIEDNHRRTATSMVATGVNCSFCKGSHRLYACQKFLHISPSKRFEHVKGANLCLNCLGRGHNVHNCPSRSCIKCNKKHNTLLHMEERATTKLSQCKESNSPTAGQSMPQEKGIILAARKVQDCERYVLLGTAIVKVFDKHGEPFRCRALLDSGSQLNLMSKQLAKQLGLPERTESIAIEGVGEQRQSSSKRVNVRVQSMTNSFSISIEARILPQIISQQPSRQLNIESWPIPKNVNLADVNFNKPGSIDLLLGAEVYFSLLSVGQIQLGKGLPRLQNTVLGWIIAGPTTQTQQELAVCAVCSGDEALNEQVERFWHLEEIRGKRSQKSYIAVFCCFTTKAVHLEVVTDLSTPGFLGALRRFIGRRGLCKTMFCDNATNFVGAKGQLEELRQMIENDQSREDITSEGVKIGIDFKFIPPRAPHFGGLWEAAVKSAKHLLQHTLASANLTYEELETVVIEVEAILNSRPLTPMSSSPDDLTALTPGHFLIGEPLLNPIDPHAAPQNHNLLTRWKLVTHVKSEFWRRWSMEYLNQLQSRYKWKQKCQNAEKGTMVIMKDDHLPPLKWSLGRIVEVFKGKDGLARVADVRTCRGVLRRPIHKLAPLPIEEDIKTPTDTSKDATAISDTHISQATIEAKPSTSRAENNKDKNPRKKQKRSMGEAIVTVLLACMVIGQSTASTVEIKPFQSQPGIYFENLGMANIVTSEWQLISYYNMTPFWNEFNALMTYHNLLESVCLKMEQQTSCRQTIYNLQHITQQIEENNKLLLPTQVTGRSKRGALNFVGNIANALFGVLDAEYAERMSETIDSLHQNEKHLQTLIANQTSVLDATINIIRRDQEAMNMQLKEWAAHVDKFTAGVNEMKQELLQERLSNAFTSIAMQMYIISSSFQQTQTSILNVLTDTHHGKLNPLLVTPHQLSRQLKQIRNNLQPSLRLPAVKDDILQYYNLIVIQGRPTLGHIIFKLTLPLISTEDFHLFNVVPVPVPLNHTFVMIQPSSHFLIANLHRDEYRPLKDLSSCALKINHRYLCKQVQPLFRRNSNVSACEIQLLNYLPHPPSCRTVTINQESHWIPLHDPNQWIYVMKEKTKVNMVCKNRAQQINLEGSGILSLLEDCIIKQSHLSIRSHNRIQATTSSSYLPPSNLTDTINWKEPPLIEKLNYSYHPQLLELETLKRQIDQLKTEELMEVKPREIHQFAVGYISILLIVIIVIGFVLRHYRSRIFRNRTNKKTPIPTPRATQACRKPEDTRFQINFDN